MERTYFRVVDNSQLDSGRRRGQRGGYRRSMSDSLTRPIRCYKCDEVGHLSHDYPLPNGLGVMITRLMVTLLNIVLFLSRYGRLAQGRELKI